MASGGVRRRLRATMAPRLPDDVLPPPLAIPPGVLIGAHMSIAGGTWRALERGHRLGMTAVQLFVKNNNRWEGKPLGDDEGERFRAAEAAAGRPVSFAHNCYLINLASPDATLRERSIEAMVDELERCAVLGIPGLVAHPGAHLGEGEATGIAKIAASLDATYERLRGRLAARGISAGAALPEVWLETTAGQGSSIGCRFEHLRDILAAAACERHLAVCLDTCHVFAAGYDLRDAVTYDAMWGVFERTVGRGRLRAIHVNDSKKGLGSRVDRHAHLGHGMIGAEAFGLLMRDARLAAIPKVLETPKGDESVEDWRNLALLLDGLDGGDRTARIEREIARLPGHDFSAGGATEAVAKVAVAAKKTGAARKAGAKKAGAGEKAGAKKVAARQPDTKTPAAPAKPDARKPGAKKPVAKKDPAKKPAPAKKADTKKPALAKKADAKKPAAAGRAAPKRKTTTTRAPATPAATPRPRRSR